MTIRFADMLYNARRCSQMTTEAAAKLLGVSPRTIQHYEAGERAVPDSAIAGMVVAYGAPSIGYHYLSHELETGRLLLPPVLLAGVASRSIRLRMAVDHVKALLPELDAICLDDFVDEAERGALAGNISKFRELASACMGIQMMVGFYAKEKDVPAATRTSSARA